MRTTDPDRRSPSSEPTTAVVEIEGLVRRFRDGRTALAHVDLRIEPGEVVALIGRNAAGKTTLIESMLGLQPIQHGTVRVFGRDPATDPVAVKRRVGYVADDDLVPGHLLVSQAFGLYRRLFPRWDADRARELCASFGLLDDVHVRALSKGQRRQLAVTLALSTQPDLIVLDEPAEGMDPAVRRRVLTAAIDALGDEGRSVLFASHQMQDVERLASRIVFLHDGMVLLDEPLDRLREEYAILTFDPGDVEPALLRAEALRWRRDGGRLRAVVALAPAQARDRWAPRCGGAVHAESATLEDLFVELVEGGRR